MSGKITLSPRERQLRELLLAAAAYIDRNKKEGSPNAGYEPLTVRWAGGWVRDKLLGIQSHDIDIAINTMAGENFALGLREFCSTEETREAHDLQKGDMQRLHTIKKNPERSKHLETATTMLYGLDLDFVNLRKETYVADSRNPQIEFGTAVEDALRRDATVNALFYNIHTGQVEDFTGGLKDMDSKLIRTPLPPLQTFTDDPLRVLRLIRFASRLQFRIDEAAEQVMSDKKVLEALKLKISRERVGIELEKMMQGKHPRDALALLDRLGLYHAVFTDPAQPDLANADISNWQAVYECLDMLEKTQTPGSIYAQLVRSAEARQAAWTLAALTPLEQLEDARPPKPGKPSVPIAFLAAREGFKAPMKFCDLVASARRNRTAILILKDVVINKAEGLGERDRFGMAIREWEHKGGWRLQVLSAILVDVMQRTAGETGQDRSTVLAEWQQFLDYLVELDVTEAASIKRLIDGTILAKALKVKPGKWMAQALDVIMAWQLRNPDSTDVEAAVDEVRKRKEELEIP